MSPAEVSHKLCQKLQQLLECVEWRLTRTTFGAQLVRRARPASFGVSPAIFKERLRTLFPWELDKQVFIREYVSTGNQENGPAQAVSEFPVFELCIDPSRADIDWHCDPKTGRRWPLRCSHFIDIRNATAVGEVDYIWRINRCQHLIPLAQLSYLHDDRHLASLVLDRLENWIDSNPYCTGVNWTSPMEAAIRCISWTIILAYLAHTDYLPDGILSKIISSMRLQADFAYRHRSRYSSANNHLIVELTGLITTSLLLRGHNKAETWLRNGLRHLSREVEKQVFPDGVSREQSTHYHGLVLDCLLWISILTERARIQIPDALVRKTEVMCEFIASIMDSGGHVPQIGDSDDGHLLWLADLSEVNNFRSQLATAAVIFGRSDFRALARDFDQKSFWLLGSGGLRQFNALRRPTSELESRSFPDGGYYVLRAGKARHERLLLFDCGPIGYPSTAAHGHADALSVCLSLEGHPTLIDPGTYTYLEFPQWRDFFRSTACHNTVMINQSNQSQIGGPYVWIKKARARCHTWYASPLFDYVEGSHDGYLQRPHKAGHRRRILFIKPDYWIIEDCLNATNPVEAEVLFHFSAGKTSLSSSNTHYTYQFIPCSDKPGLQVVLPAYPGVHVQSLRGSDSSMQGWISPSYGRKVPSSVLSVSTLARSRFRLLYLLIPLSRTIDSTLRRNDLIELKRALVSDSGHASFRLASQRYQDDIYFSFDSTLSVSLGELVVRAQTVWLRSTELGFIDSVVLIAPLETLWRGMHSDIDGMAFCLLRRSPADGGNLSLRPLRINETIEPPRLNAVKVT